METRHHPTCNCKTGQFIKTEITNEGTCSYCGYYPVYTVKVKKHIPNLKFWIPKENRLNSFLEKRREIVRLYESGMTVQQIATELGYSMGTIDMIKNLTGTYKKYRTYFDNMGIKKNRWKNRRYTHWVEKIQDKYE